MNEIILNDKISYIEATDDPLSADIGIIRDRGVTWLYDVGNDEKSVTGLNGSYHIVLSHFHQDHTGNIDRVRADALYLSNETRRHIGRGTVADRDIPFGSLRIFPLPSCHAKGCLGLEIDQTWAFVGDALYSKYKDGYYLYNAQLLKDEIGVLKKLAAPYLLVSHYKGLIRNKEDVIRELETVYAMKEKDTAVIRIGSTDR